MGDDIRIDQNTSLGATATQIGVQINYAGLSPEEIYQKVFTFLQSYCSQLRQELLAEFSKMFEERIKYIPSENIVPPAPRIAVPVLQNASITGEQEIRELYAKLLASSMDKATSDKVHPSYIEIIKQLTPDEAKLLKALSPSLRSRYPVLEVRIKSKEGYQIIYSNYTDIADEICDKPENIPEYLENLDRLKLIQLDMEIFITDESKYERLKNSSVIKRIISNIPPEGYTYEYGNGSFRLSSFGLSFINMCVLGK